MKCNQSRPGFELVSPSPFSARITITPRPPPSYFRSLSSWTNLQLWVFQLTWFPDPGVRIYSKEKLFSSQCSLCGMTSWNMGFFRIQTTSLISPTNYRQLVIFCSLKNDHVLAFWPFIPPPQSRSLSASLR